MTDQPLPSRDDLAKAHQAEQFQMAVAEAVDTNNRIVFENARMAAARGDRRGSRRGLKAVRRIPLPMLLLEAHRVVAKQVEARAGEPVPAHDVSGEPLLPEFVAALTTVVDGPGKTELSHVIVRRRSDPWKQCVDASASLVQGAQFKEPREPLRK